MSGFTAFLSGTPTCFYAHTLCLVQKAQQYVYSLVQAETSNISQICQTVMDANYEQMQLLSCRDMHNIIAHKLGAKNDDQAYFSFSIALPISCS